MSNKERNLEDMTRKELIDKISEGVAKAELFEGLYRDIVEIAENDRKNNIENQKKAKKYDKAVERPFAFAFEQKKESVKARAMSILPQRQPKKQISAFKATVMKKEIQYKKEGMNVDKTKSLVTRGAKIATFAAVKSINKKIDSLSYAKAYSKTVTKNIGKGIWNATAGKLVSFGKKASAKFQEKKIEAYVKVSHYLEQKKENAIERGKKLAKGAVELNAKFENYMDKKGDQIESGIKKTAKLGYKYTAGAVIKTGVATKQKYKTTKAKMTKALHMAMDKEEILLENKFENYKRSSKESVLGRAVHIVKNEFKEELRASLNEDAKTISDQYKKIKAVNKKLMASVTAGAAEAGKEAVAKRVDKGREL